MTLAVTVNCDEKRVIRADNPEHIYFLLVGNLWWVLSFATLQLLLLTVTAVRFSAYCYRTRYLLSILPPTVNINFTPRGTIIYIPTALLIHSQVS
jgi:hypothetical protein